MPWLEAAAGDIPRISSHNLNKWLFDVKTANYVIPETSAGPDGAFRIAWGNQLDDLTEEFQKQLDIEVQNGVKSDTCTGVCTGARFGGSAQQRLYICSRCPEDLLCKACQDCHSHLDASESESSENSSYLSEGANPSIRPATATDIGTRRLHCSCSMCIWLEERSRSAVRVDRDADFRSAHVTSERALALVQSKFYTGAVPGQQAKQGLRTTNFRNLYSGVKKRAIIILQEKKAAPQKEKKAIKFIKKILKSIKPYFAQQGTLRILVALPGYSSNVAATHALPQKSQTRYHIAYSFTRQNVLLIIDKRNFRLFFGDGPEADALLKYTDIVSKPEL